MIDCPGFVVYWLSVIAKVESRGKRDERVENGVKLDWKNELAVHKILSLQK